MEDNLFKTPLCFMLLFLLCLVLRVVYIIWWKPKYLEKFLRQQGIGGTSYKLFHGDLEEIKNSTIKALSKPIPLNHHLIGSRVFPFFHNMVETYGKVCLSWYGTRPRIIICEPELIRMILQDKNGDFVKPPLNPLVKLLQRGIASLDGEQWAKRRRTLTPAFHFDKLKRMMPAFSTSCLNLIHRWKSLMSVEGSCEIDVAPEFQNLTLDVIARTAFGTSFEEGKRIFELQKEQTTLVLEAYNSFYIPGFRFIPTKKNKKRYKLDYEIKSILRDMISKKEEEMRNGEVGTITNDLLGLLLECKIDDDNSMTIEDVIEECKLFYIAGQETSAQWLTWTMIVLSMHPIWQEKAREEVLRICGKKIPDFEVLNQLKTVSMVFHEVLRLYPPVSFLFRYAQKKTNIGGLTIPCGVETFLMTIFLHYDPKYWGEDVEEFNPGRFSEGVVKASKEQMAFFPFGWGPRICLGQSFAMIEAKMALVLILQHFTFQLSPSYTHSPCFGLTLQPQHGAPIILHPLSSIN